MSAWICSAWICSARHIATIATYYAGDIDCLEAIQGIADYLLQENIKSVNHRYDEDTVIEPCNIDEVAGDLAPHDLVALCHCLEYQSCEHRDEDLALDAITAHFEAQVVDSQKSELWGI